MRCPKCSYISFDIVESCNKCGKKINKAVEELRGTIAEVAAPLFLRFDVTESQPEADTFEEAEGFAGEEVAVDLGMEEEESVDFSLDEEDATETEALDFAIEEEPEIDLAPEEPEAEEVEIDLAAEEPEKELGISDLAPSEEVAEEPAEEEMVFEEEAVVEEVAAEVDQEAGELEDLEVEGIDLQSKAATGDKVMPSVKTGTALDDFDIDLGDLIPGKKKE